VCCVSHFEASMVRPCAKRAGTPCWLRNAHAARATRAPRASRTPRIVGRRNPANQAATLRPRYATLPPRVPQARSFADSGYRVPENRPRVQIQLYKPRVTEIEYNVTTTGAATAGRRRRRICIKNPMQNGQQGAETGIPHSGPAGGPCEWNQSRRKLYAFRGGHRRHTRKSKIWNRCFECDVRIWTFRNVYQVQKLRRMAIWGCPP